MTKSMPLILGEDACHFFSPILVLMHFQCPTFVNPADYLFFEVLRPPNVSLTGNCTIFVIEGFLCANSKRIEEFALIAFRLPVDKIRLVSN